MNPDQTIQKHHLNRKAVIYIRQSTPQQVLSNLESQKLQYALKQKAEGLGWDNGKIEIIDSDLGKSGTSTEGRKGFESLMGQVTLGDVGIILCYDVSRLSRNCTDWYPLLDVCSFRKCLIGDRDGVYDPSSFNGRALLGFKGQMSELEMHTIKSRLKAGVLSKASRGELPQKLPVGFVRDKLGRIVKDPNLEVQKRIELLFSTFMRLQTVNKVVKYFLENNLDQPRHTQWNEVVWRKPTHDSAMMTLKNPAYAGTYVYGRTAARANLYPCNGYHPCSRKIVKREDWQFVIEDKYPAYITKENFELIQTKIVDNYATYSFVNATRGVPRQGSGLLHGLVYCGKCSHKMHIRYREGNRPSYYGCRFLQKQYKSPVCQSMPSDPIDKVVADAFLSALSPAEINLYSKLLEEKCAETKELEAANQQKLERLRYQARLAERQFNEVDPANRLVAAELERRWEAALQEFNDAEFKLKQARTQQQIVPNLLSHKMKKALENIGGKLPSLWHDDLLDMSQKKALLRSLVEKVVLDRKSSENVHVRIVWKGGASSEFNVGVVANSIEAMSSYSELVSKVLALTNEGLSDREIALNLTAQGYRSPRRAKIPTHVVAKIRSKNGIRKRPGSNVNEPPDRMLVLARVSDQLGVLHEWREWFCQTIMTGSLSIGDEIVKSLDLSPAEIEIMSIIRKKTRHLLFTNHSA